MRKERRERGRVAERKRERDGGGRKRERGGGGGGRKTEGLRVEGEGGGWEGERHQGPYAPQGSRKLRK